jgi:predicted ArsR family transcriptional regulator
MAMRSRSERIASVAVLDDPTRRAMFDFVAASGSAVTRDVAAEALHLSRRVAALHLDKLADHGLLTVEYRRLNNRTGPGAGRPAKLYRCSSGEVAVSVPERHYDLIGELFVAAVAQTMDTGADIAATLDKTAYDAGHAIGAETGDVAKALQQSGYQPTVAGNGATLTLRNCPFHQLAQRHTELVCGLNLRLLEGIAAGAGDLSLTPALDPAPGHCCVRLNRASERDATRQ